MRSILPLVGVVALAACTPSIPDSGAGVGFGSYQDYLRDRERQAQTAQVQAQPQITSQPIADAPLQVATDQFVAGQQSAGQGAGPVGQPLTAIPDLAGGSRPAGISDEQDFDAVAARETIESDRERLEQQRQQYVAFEPTALPERPEDIVNIVAFALGTSHPVGVQRYRRSALRFSNWQDNCRQFRTQDEAQEEFLRRGGPERDPLNIDPDGDGYACWWDPEPFRAVARTNQ